MRGCRGGMKFLIWHASLLLIISEEGIKFSVSMGKIFFEKNLICCTIVLSEFLVLDSTNNGISSPSLILSLTAAGRKNHCIPCAYWGAMIFAVVLNYSNLFPAFTVYAPS